jgi:hypothetical protein
MALRLLGTLLFLIVVVRCASVDADSNSPLTPKNLTNIPFVFDFTIFSRRTRDTFQYNGTLGKVMDSNRRWELYSLISQNDATLFYYANSKMATLKPRQTSSPKCVDPQAVLLDDLLADSFFQAKPLDNADVQDELVNTCVGPKWTIRVMNDLYVLCSQGSEWMIFAKLWYGQTSNFQAGVTVSNSDKTQLVNKVQSCKTGVPVPIVNEEPEAWYEINRRTRQTSQVAPNNTCIFIHGAGTLVDATTISTSETDYWDGITEYITQCKKTYFITTDTKRRGYYDVSLQREICNLMLIGEPDNVVRNKIVFTHSMGLMVVAGALNNRFCSLDNSTALYASQGPAYGSSLALKLIDICRDDTYRNLVGSIWSDYCLDFPFSRGIPFNSYASLIRNHEMDKLTTLIRSKINGIMCGNTASGLTSTDGAALSILQNFHWTNETNDGMVPISSCNASLPIGTSLVADFNNAFYIGDINHSDGTCRNGDGWTGSPKRNPCSWFGKRLGTGIYTRRP